MQEGGRSNGAMAHSWFGWLPMRKRNSPSAKMSAWPTIDQRAVTSLVQWPHPGDYFATMALLGNAHANITLPLPATTYCRPSNS